MGVCFLFCQRVRLKRYYRKEGGGQLSKLSWKIFSGDFYLDYNFSLLHRIIFPNNFDQKYYLPYQYSLLATLLIIILTVFPNIAAWLIFPLLPGAILSPSFINKWNISCHILLRHKEGIKQLSKHVSNKIQLIIIYGLENSAYLNVYSVEKYLVGVLDLPFRRYMYCRPEAVSLSSFESSASQRRLLNKLKNASLSASATLKSS